MTVVNHCTYFISVVTSSVVASRSAAWRASLLLSAGDGTPTRAASAATEVRVCTLNELGISGHRGQDTAVRLYLS
jgi:hypothetical protein